MFWAVLAVVGGLVVLILSADRLVIAAVRISQSIGVSAVLVGALVVGFGTSVPELLVSALAAGNDRVDVALANVVGSNIANLSLVLGTAAIIIAIVADRVTLRREGVMMLVSVILLSIVLWDLEVQRWEGVVLLLGMAAALVLLVIWSRDDAEAAAEARQEVEEMAGAPTVTLRFEVIIAVVTLAATVVSARVLLEGALFIGDELSLSDAFLGVMLGVGTSLPELATAVAATRRGETDLVLGNVLGSNVFNSLGVAGLAIVVGPGALMAIDRPLIVVMLAVAAAAGYFAVTGRRLVRWEGVVLVAGFLAIAVLSL